MCKYRTVSQTVDIPLWMLSSPRRTETRFNEKVVSDTLAIGRWAFMGCLQRIAVDERKKYEKGGEGDI